MEKTLAGYASSAWFDSLSLILPPLNGPCSSRWCVGGRTLRNADAAIISLLWPVEGKCIRNLALLHAMEYAVTGYFMSS